MPENHDLQTKGVQTLLGDPRKAIRKLSAPIIVALISRTLYNVTDAIWVSGLGPDALSAVGFYFPFFIFIIALANGLATGVGACISRFIGANDKTNANSAATHGMVILLLFVAPLTAFMLFFSRMMFSRMGASGTPLEYTIAYSRIMFSGTFIIFFNLMGNSILHSEGDAKKSMLAMLTGSILNIVLDPIFIYTLGLGVSGAAWATLISMSSVSIVVIFLLFIQKRTYISIQLRKFRFRKMILKDIAGVGLPASFSQMSMSIMMFSMTAIISKGGGTLGVAIFYTGWRIVTMATLPMMGVARAVTAVVGAAFGAKDPGKMRTAYLYSLKSGLMLECVLALLVFIFAPIIVRVFTWSDAATEMTPGLIQFLRIVCFIFPATAVGMLSSAMFQGIGKGLAALLVSLTRTVFTTLPLAWFFGVYLEMGLTGVWIGMAGAGLILIPTAFGWAMWHLKRQSTILLN